MYSIESHEEAWFETKECEATVINQGIFERLFTESVFGVPTEHSVPLGTRQDSHMKFSRGGGMKKVRVVFLDFMSCFRR